MYRQGAAQTTGLRAFKTGKTNNLHKEAPKYIYIYFIQPWAGIERLTKLNHSSRIRLLRFSKSKNATFYVFEVSCQKRKKRIALSKFSTFVRFEIANRHFRCKTITHVHVMLYIQHYITRKLCYRKDDRAMRSI